jgi:hypothetical protein
MRKVKSALRRMIVGGVLLFVWAQLAVGTFGN